MSDPQLTRQAQEELDHLVSDLRPAIFAEAQRRAQAAGLDAISPLHIQESYRSMLPHAQGTGTLKSWADVGGGILLGLGGSGVSDLIKVEHITLPPVLWTIGFIVSGLLSVAYAKHRRP